MKRQNRYVNLRRQKNGREAGSRGVVGQKSREVIQTSGMAMPEACEHFLAGQNPAECSITSIRSLQFKGHINAVDL